MRSERLPMSRHDRSQFFWKLAPGLCLLFATYILITILRSFRDDFAVEIWKGLGESGKPAIFAQSETAVMLGVMAVTGAAMLLSTFPAAKQGFNFSLASGEVTNTNRAGDIFALVGGRSDSATRRFNVSFATALSCQP